MGIFESNEKTVRDEIMKFKLLIDEDLEEEIIVIANKQTELTAQIEDLVNNYSKTFNVIGYREDEMRKLSFEDIECITILDRKVIAIDTSGQQYRINERLRDLESVLPDYFMRINKSNIANEHRILKFETLIGGGVDAIFKCGYKDYVSRRCFKDIKRRYGS